MRAMVGLVLAVAASLGAGATSAQAITGNAEADFQHEYVGLVTFYDASGSFVSRCSGSLLTDTVLLTAGHCADVDAGVTSARVYFEQDAGLGYDPAIGYDPRSGYPVSGGVTSSTLHGYGFKSPVEFPDTSDLGLVVLDAPVQTVYPDIDTYASLPAPGAVDEYGTGQDAVVTVSGYGMSFTNPAITESHRSRLAATTFVLNLVSQKAGGYNLQIATSPGNGRGGTCFGDSGGPVLLGDTDVVLGVSSFALGRGATCGGTGFAYRTDSAEVVSWILDRAGNEAEEISVVDRT